MTTNGIIKLDIGGTLFTTTISTLSRYDSMLRTMLTTEVPVTKDEQECVFIDRDSRHFRFILNFLRDGHVVLPESIREVKEILAEARYYLLQPLIELCEERLEQADNPFYHVVSTVLEARKLIFASEKPVVVLRLPLYLGTKGGIVNYYFSEQKFQELSKQHHRIVRFVLITEPEFNEDCGWSFFLKGRKRSARIKGPSDSNLLEECLREVLQDAKKD
ncbi:unnamed protein product [Caenorhabditis sp. 36 PRJEB53466]|nr:unnamed protein product [Caenorhabditis sp. 36 PRJEB53466]